MKTKHTVKLVPLLFLFLFTSCTDESYTVLIQHTWENADTIDFCLVLSDKKHGFKEALICETTESDSVLWKKEILQTDDNHYYAKRFNLRDFEHRMPYFLNVKVNYKGENISVSADSPEHLTKYLIVTLKGNNTLESLYTDKKPDLEGKTIDADPETLKHLK